MGSGSDWTLIGALLGERGSDGWRAAARLRAADFGEPEAGRVFECLRDMRSTLGRAELAGLEDALRERCGAAPAAAAMLKATSAFREHSLESWRIAQLVGRLRCESQRRAMRRVGSELLRLSGEEDGEPSEAIDRARAELREACRSGAGVLGGGMTAIAAMEAAECGEGPVQTGIGSLDAALCGGFVRSEVTVIGGRPGSCKSAALLTMAAAAARAGKRVLFVSLEMDAVQMGRRLLSGASGVSATRMRAGRSALGEGDWQRMAGGLEKCGTLDERLGFLFARGMRVEDLRMEAMNRMDEAGLDLLVVDYLQLLETARRGATDLERIGAVSRTLKTVALELEIPVLAAAQVRRQNQGFEGERAPALDELRGSGDIEQDADCVLLLHRVRSPEDALLRSRSYREECEGMFERAAREHLLLLTFEVAKQRQGPLGRAWALYDPLRMRFTEG